MCVFEFGIKERLLVRSELLLLLYENKFKVIGIMIIATVFVVKQIKLKSSLCQF